MDEPHFISVAAACARLLLENGPNANSRDNVGNPILSTACVCPNKCLVPLLLRHGATVSDKETLSGESLLHKFAKFHWLHVETMVLLEYGANPQHSRLPRQAAA